MGKPPSPANCASASAGDDGVHKVSDQGPAAEGAGFQWCGIARFSAFIRDFLLSCALLEKQSRSLCLVGNQHISLRAPTQSCLQDPSYQVLTAGWFQA